MVKAGSPAKEHVHDCHSPSTPLRCKAGWALGAVEAHLVYTKIGFLWML